MWKQLTRIGSMKPGETQLPSLMFDLFASLSKREYVQAKVPHRTIETSRYASNQHQRSFDNNVWVDVYDPNSKKRNKSAMPFRHVEGRYAQEHNSAVPSIVKNC